MLPHDGAAEQCTLGGMLLSADAIADVIEALDDRDWYRPEHGVIFKVIVALYERGDSATESAVVQELERQGLLESVGGASYLGALVATVPTATNAGHYAAVVEEKAVLRRLAQAGARIAELSRQANQADGVDIGVVLDQARLALVDVASLRSDSGAPQFDELVMSTLDDIDTVATHGTSTRRVPTGFADLDDITGGFPRGSLVVIDAYPGVGASTLALDFIRSAAVKHRIPAAYLSLDNPSDAVTQRLLSAEAKVRLSDLRTGRMTNDDWSRMANRMKAISESPIHIVSPDNVDIAAIAKTITNLAATEGVQLVVVDPLHLATARRDLAYENREREVAEVTRRLKRLALDNDIVVVATAQLSNNPGPRQPIPPLPSLADLRDSGTIAHVADHVLLIHRPDAWKRDHPRAGEADLKLAKHRHCVTATAVVAHQLHYSRFADLAHG
ncbi:DnaB-like helicase C-terminal domain-containing protein [Actinokineospora globicatena]|uniref:DNA 5'-3' helicase n=1 Tax=Actinokineospora globicatena TaxID=103729 RepID=A0A9W6QKH2_9PSEU|nr:DnaB-like helicase C-terminal domain-containing protein [Actinokineospora globicatena]GLW90159.1 replicative DNA helicase [Actinokineospora globicatena]